MSLHGYLNTGLFPVAYQIGNLTFFATKAAAESDSQVSKCELFYLHRHKKLFGSNHPSKLVFKSSADAIGFLDQTPPFLLSMTPGHIAIVGIFYERSLETEVYQSTQYVQDSAALLNDK